MEEKYLYPESTRLRVYTLDKREIFEVIETVDGHDFIQCRKEYDLGESAVEFLYGSYKGIFDFLTDSGAYLANINAGKQTVQSWEKLMGHTSYMPTSGHPYFGLAAQVTNRLYQQAVAPLPVDALSSMVPLSQTVRDDIRVLVSECLNVELRQENTVAELYAELLQKHGFPVDALAYREVRTEVVPVNAPNSKRGLKPELLSVEELHKQGVKTALAEVLYPETVLDLYCYLKSLYLRNEVRFKPCKHCGRYFVLTGNGSTEYCNRPIIGSTKTCRQIGAVRIYQSKQLENPAVKAFTKSYKTHNARVRYGTLSHEGFASWSKEARVMRDKCVSGEIPLDELQDWLDSH